MKSTLKGIFDVNKLKVCIVSLRSLPLFDGAYDSENVIGGAEINMYNLALFFSGMESIETKVLVDDYGQPASYRKGNIELIRYGGTKTGAKTGARTGAKTEAKRRSLPEKLFTKAATYARLFAISADAFIFTSSHPMLGVLVLLQQLARRKKVLFRLSSDLNADLSSFRSTNSKKDYLLYRFGLYHCTTIITQTEQQRRLLKNLTGLESHIIENGFFVGEPSVDENKPLLTDKVVTETQTAEIGDAAVNRRDHILWVGRCIRSKRPLLFIELARRFHGYQFVMVMPKNKAGDPAGSADRDLLEREVYSSAAQLENLKIIDYVPYNEIQGYFDNARLYVTTSDLEGFPNTFIQACAGGTPILSFRIDPDGMLEKYNLGCCCEDDMDKAQIFMEGLDDALLQEYGYTLPEYVLQHHNICKTAEKYLELIGGYTI